MISNLEWKDYCYNAGYNDALHGHDKCESFNEAMRTGAMEEYYDRGWSDGTQDRNDGR